MRLCCCSLDRGLDEALVDIKCDALLGQHSALTPHLVRGAFPVDVLTQAEVTLDGCAKIIGEAFLLVNIGLIPSSSLAAGSLCVILLELHVVLSGYPGHEASGVSSHQWIFTSIAKIVGIKTHSIVRWLCFPVATFPDGVHVKCPVAPLLH